MLRFVHDNIKLYNVRRERRVHLTGASSVGFVQNFHCICEHFEVIMYNQLSRCFKTTDCDHSVCTILSDHTVLSVSLDTKIQTNSLRKRYNVQCTLYTVHIVEQSSFHSKYFKKTSLDWSLGINSDFLISLSLHLDAEDL